MLQALQSMIQSVGEYLDETPYQGTATTWLNHTTILCFSEFMRTPLINERGGRDHWLTNACMLVGGGITPGVIGESSNLGMSPTPTNLMTGLRDDRADVQPGVTPRPTGNTRRADPSRAMDDDTRDAVARHEAWLMARAARRDRDRDPGRDPDD